MAEADWDEVRYIGKRQPKSGTLKTQQVIEILFQKSDIRTRNFGQRCLFKEFK